MSDTSQIVGRWQRLRHHPAFQAAAVYAGASWALIQVADIFFPSLNAVRWLGILLVIGFVVVIGVAWRMAEPATAESAGAGPDAAGPDASARSGRRRRRYAYSATAALLILGGVFWWIRPSILGAVAPDAQVIAVLPFNTSGPGVELLGEGMVDLLSTNLDAVGGIRTVDSRTVLHRWRQRAVDGSLDLEGGLALARDVDAGAVLLGSVVSVGPEVRLTAKLYSVRGQELASARVDGHADSVLALVDGLGIELLREIWLAHEPVPNLRVSGMTTSSLDAIRAYLKGQQHYRRSEWDSALVAFQEAVEIDSTFALAHYRLGYTYGWTQGLGSSSARRHGRAALRQADRLPAKERTLVAAHVLFEDGDLAAHDTMVRYVRRYPDDPEGWYMLGDIRYHALPLLDLDEGQIFGPFDRLLELDPSLVPAIIHPLELSLVYSDSTRFQRYLAALETAAESSYAAPFRVGELFWENPDSLLAALESVLGADRLSRFIMLGSYRSSHLTPAVLLPGLKAATRAPGVDDRERIDIFQSRALILASLGRLDESAALFDTLWAIAPNQSAAHSGLGAVYAGIADSSFADRTFQVLANPPPVPGLEPLVLYSRAMHALSQGRSAEARRLAERALSADTSLFAEFLPSLLAAELGWADMLDGDTIAGLEKMRSGLAEAGYASGPVMDFSDLLRLALAMTLASRVESRAEGIRRLRYGLWFEDLLHIPLSYLALGEALEAAGDRAGAARAYNQFIRLWEKADPALQPRVESARRALERLAAENLN